MGLAFHQYSQDYDERCITWYTDAGGGKYNYWQAQLYPYMKSLQLWACPSETKFNPTAVTTDLTGPTTGVAQFAPYGLNLNLFQFIYTGGVYTTIPVAQIDFPALTVVIADSALTSDTSYGGYVLELPNGVYGYAYKPFERHLETCNSLFADGHVKAMKITELTKTTVNTDQRNVIVQASGQHYLTNVTPNIYPYFQTSADPSHVYWWN